MDYEKVDGGLPGGNVGFNAGFQARVSHYYNHPLPVHNIPVIDLEMMRETFQQLYWPALRQIGHPEFYNPYPDYVDVNNLYPRGYR